MRSFKSLVKNKLQKELDGEAGKEKERKDEFLSPEAGPLILLVARDGSVASLLCKSKASERSAAQKVLGSWRVGSQEGALPFLLGSAEGPGRPRPCQRQAGGPWTGGEASVVIASCRLEGGRRLATSTGPAVRPGFSSCNSSQSHTTFRLDGITCGTGRQEPPGRPHVRNAAGALCGVLLSVGKEKTDWKGLRGSSPLGASSQGLGVEGQMWALGLSFLPLSLCSDPQGLANLPFLFLPNHLSPSP